MSASASLAVRTISDLMTDARSDYVKLEAAKDVLDRAGFTREASLPADVGAQIADLLTIDRDISQYCCRMGGTNQP